MICFCRPGTRSTGSSTPRSPRATIRPSERAMMRVEVGDGRRLLDLGDISRRAWPTSWRASAARPRRAARTTAPSSRRRARSAKSRSASVLVGERPDRQHGVGQADALAARQRAADQHRRRRCRCAFFSMTLMRILPSSSSSVCPGSTASKICGCGRNTRSAPPGALGADRSGRWRRRRANTRPPANSPTRNFGPCRSARMPIGRPKWRLAAERTARAALLHQVVRGVAHVDAEHVDARLEQALDHLRGGRRRAQAWRRS